MHIDLDAFFASVEVRENPALKEKPVIVGADPKKGRGVVSTCNYPARKYGIRSGMPITHAFERCPEGIFLPVRMKLYMRTAEKIMEIFRKYAGKFEQTSVDEAYLDVSSKVKTYSGARKLAKKIKDDVWRSQGLTCSVGIGPNKLIAKMSSDINKPNGITVVKPQQVRNFLSDLDVRKIPGVGPRTAGYLNQYNIQKISDLLHLSEQKLIKIFGVHGSYLYYRSRGIDHSEVRVDYIPKSFGHRTTFLRDTKDEDIIFNAMRFLVKNAFKRMKNTFSFYKTITVTVRYKDFETKTKAKTLKDWHSDETTAQILARQLTWSFLGDPRKVRLVGVSLSNLK